MDYISSILSESAPKSVLSRILQGIFALPASMSRYLIQDYIAVKPEHLDWIRFIEKDGFKAACIGPAMDQCENEDQVLRKIKSADVVIYKLHGGGFRIGCSTMFMDVFIKWIVNLKKKYNLNVVIFSVEYSLAPEFKYPISVLECFEAFKYLVDTLKIPGSRIILSGDSAGGSHGLEVLIRYYAPDILSKHMDSPRTNYNADLPAGAFFSSPVVSANIQDWLWEFKHDLVTKTMARNVIRDYLSLPGGPTENLHVMKMISIKSRFDRFLPKNVLFYIGDNEVMRDDILKMTGHIKSDGRVNITIRKERELLHDWYFIRGVLRKDQNYILDGADDQFVDFVSRSVQEAMAEKLAVVLQKVASSLVMNNGDDEKEGKSALVAGNTDIGNEMVSHDDFKG